MARERVVEAPALKNWEDVDGALEETAEAQLTTDDIKTELDHQINRAKAIAARESKPYHDHIAKLERDLKDLVEEHRNDLGKSKTRMSNFGEVGFRLSTSVFIPKAKEKVTETIRCLKARQMTGCIIVKEKISKDALKKHREDTVNAVGATWEQKDTFGYEAYSEKLERTL